MKSNKRQIAQNTLMLYFRMLFTMVVSLYSSRILLKELGVIDFGIYNVVGGVVIMFLFLNSSMAASTSRFIAFELGKGNYEQLNKVFSISVVNHLAIVFVVFILAETVGMWFLYAKLVIPPERISAALWVYQFSIFSSMLSLMQSPFNALIIAHERIGIYAWGNITDSILKLLIVVLLGYIEYDKLKLYGMMVFVAVAIMLLFNIIACRILFSYCKFKFYRDIQAYKTMLAYSGWDLFGNFSTIAQGQGLNMLLNIFFGPAVNAARGVSYQVQGAVNQFGVNLMTAIRPQIIKLYAVGEKKEMINLVFLGARYSFFLLWLFTLPILLQTEYILSLWLKSVPENSVIFIQLILFIGLINSWETPFIIAMHATGKIKIPNIICGTLLIMVLPVSYLFLKLGFAASSVFVVFLCIVFVNLWIEWFLIHRLVGFSLKDAIRQVLAKSVAVMLLSGILPFLLNQMAFYNNFIRFSVVVSVSFLSVLITIYFVGIKKEERDYIKLKIKDKICYG